MTERAQIAKAIRRDLKDLSIPARVKSYRSCGVDRVAVFSKDCFAGVTAEQAQKIADIAIFYELKGVRGMPINGINRFQQNFEVW